MKPGLLISVRSADEARLALQGGAALIDVKEPARGPLGRADDAQIAAVVAAVAGRVPVSAALGELLERGELPPGARELDFVKWGLAGCASQDWPRLLRQQGPGAVIVAYADAHLAGAPGVDDVLAFAASRPWPAAVMLIDTFDKTSRRTLLDWLPLEKLTVIIGDCRAAGVRLALAGSLGRDEVRRLAPLGPDWIGVRGAVCVESQRQARLEAERVAELCRLIESLRSGDSTGACSAHEFG